MFGFYKKFLLYICDIFCNRIKREREAWWYGPFSSHSILLSFCKFLNQTFRYKNLFFMLVILKYPLSKPSQTSIFPVKYKLTFLMLNQSHYKTRIILSSCGLQRIFSSLNSFAKEVNFFQVLLFSGTDWIIIDNKTINEIYFPIWP